MYVTSQRAGFVVVDFQTIYGFQLGFEIADNETKEMAGINWGLTIDLGFFRFVFTTYKDE